MITSLDQLDLSKLYTYADYLSWNFKERVEIIAGRIFRMSPGPNRQHQKVVGDIFNQLYNFLNGKTCEVYVAPFDVRFVKSSTTTDQEIVNTVQPDICVICDPLKLDDKGCLGAPDLIVEIISPSSAKRDLQHKYELYETYGVSEYWVIDPSNQIVYLNVLEENGRYQTSRPYTSDFVVKSSAITGFEIDLRTIFDDQIDDWTIMKETKVEYSSQTRLKAKSI